MTDPGMLISRIKHILIHPATTWEHLNKESRSVKTVNRSFLVPVLILVSLSAFTGSLIYNPGGLSVLYPLTRAVKHFACFYLTIIVSSWILNEISAVLIKTRDYPFNFRLVTYSMSPLFTTVFITRLIPELALINILGLYGAYILYCGLNTIENIKKKDLIRFFIVALFIILVLYFSISWISRTLLESVYFAFANNILNGQ